jgi:hypothetical protein
MAIDSGKKDKEPDVEEILEELEHRIDRLKVLYEQYFMGIEKLEPQTARKEVARKMLELTQMNLRNTALRYRFNALNQKWGVYQTYWNRVQREIEKGVYFRNVARVGREALRKGLDVPDEVFRAMPERMKAQILKQREQLAAKHGGGARVTSAPGEDAETTAVRQPRPRTHEIEADGKMFADMSFDEAFDQLFDNLTGERDEPTAVKTPQPSRPAAAPPPSPPPPRPAPPPTAAKRVNDLPPGVDEKGAHELYKRYVQAKKLVGEDASGIKYEHIVNTIKKQAPKIMEQHKARGVEFQVVIKDNKVILKAVPKK